MTQYEVKAAWEHVIVNYLQPADLIKKGLHVEIRNDNGPQFAARMVREFLLENGIHQVFTYPYCPEQNGHIESFNYSSLRPCFTKASRRHSRTAPSICAETHHVWPVRRV